MIEIDDKSDCCGCEACVQICPVECISLNVDSEGFMYPSVDEKKCINCGACDRVCPFEEVCETDRIDLKAYACYSKNDNTRFKSSSGGIFSVISEKILHDGGVVFGVAMTENNRNAEHIMIEKESDLWKLRGSKYLQCSTNGIYKKVETELRKNKKVLFSGTPCQVNALKNFLKKDYSNLICVDVICHGVPSPKLWVKYIDYVENKYHQSVKRVNFRCKEKNWTDFGMKKWISNEKAIFTSKDLDPYLQMFFKNYCLRPSCYVCKTKYDRKSDLTLGDFWGINNLDIEMDTCNGVSLVISRSKKGEKLLTDISFDIAYKCVSYEDAIKYNSAELNSVKRTKERDTFFEDMRNNDFNRLSNKYLYPTLKLKLKKVLIKIGLLNLIKNTKFKFRGGKKNKEINRYGILFELK